MKVTIDSEVQKKFPELKIFFKVVPKNSIRLDLARETNIRLNEDEKAEYTSFRKAIAGGTLLAVERLRSFDSMDELPSPDPLTNFIIRLSYSSSIPITIFSGDLFNNVRIRFSKHGEVLKVNGKNQPIRANSLVADTDQGILGQIGIRSSSLGKLTNKTKTVVVLSFGCSKSTNMKSKELVDHAIGEIKSKD